MNTNYSKRYFTSSNPTLSIFMFIFGFVFSMSGIMLIAEAIDEILNPPKWSYMSTGYEISLIYGIWGLITGIGLIVGGIIILVARAKRRISNKEYEDAIACYPENLTLAARETISIPDNEILLAPAMTFEDYKYRYRDVSEYRHSAGKMRTDLYEKSVIYLTDKYLYTYSITFRTTKQEEVINTGMFAYKDIISVILTQKNDTLHREPICIKHLEITTVGGNVIKIPYRHDEQAQQNVNQIRRILQEKKSETVQ